MRTNEPMHKYLKSFIQSEPPVIWAPIYLRLIPACGWRQQNFCGGAPVTSFWRQMCVQLMGMWCAGHPSRKFLVTTPEESAGLWWIPHLHEVDAWSFTSHPRQGWRTHLVKASVFCGPENFGPAVAERIPWNPRETARDFHVGLPPWCTPRRQKRQVAPVKFTNLWITSRMRGDSRRLHQIGKRCRDAHGRACTSLSRQKRRGIYASTSAWQSLCREVRVDFTLGEPASGKTVNVRGYKVKHNKIK